MHPPAQNTFAGSPDAFEWQRLALRPCLARPDEAELAALLARVEALGLAEFFAFLQQHRLDQLWRACLEAIEPPAAFAPWRKELRERALQLAAWQLRERRWLGVVHRLLEAQGIPYFIFKGAHLRHTIYRDQTLRSASDIDLYVPEADKLKAARTIAGEGFALRVLPENVSHEVSLIRDGVCIDLHWQLMRPGRARTDLGEWLFANREPFGDGFKGLNAQASLLVMLVHPALTKHLASPSSILIHMVDLHRLLETAAPDWQEVRETLSRAGLQTAAWSSLYVLARYSGLARHRELAAQIEPAPLRKAYLTYWIDHRLMYRLAGRPWAVRGLFSLALQDNARDMLAALRALRTARRQAAEQVRAFEGG